jgi:hypothetical protein
MEAAGVRLPEQAPGDRSVSGKHMTPPRSKGEFESRRSLACPSRPTGRAASLKRMTSGFESREGYTAWQEIHDRPGLRIPGGPLSLPTAQWKVNRPGRRARPLSDARVTPWASIALPSSEDEPARRLAPAGNRAALWGEFRVLRPLPSPVCSHRAGEQSPMESEPARDAGAAPNAAGRFGVAVRVCRSPREKQWKMRGRRRSGA